MATATSTTNGTGSEMIVWSGYNGSYFNTGGRYCAQFTDAHSDRNCNGNIYAHTHIYTKASTYAEERAGTACASDFTASPVAGRLFLYHVLFGMISFVREELPLPALPIIFHLRV